MAFALIENGAIVRTGNPPDVWRKPDGNWLDLRPRDAAVLAAAGWVAIVETPQPPDSDTTTHASAVALVDGVPTRTWVESPKPPPVTSTEDRLAAVATAVEQAATVETIADMEALREALAAALGG